MTFSVNYLSDGPSVCKALAHLCRVSSAVLHSGYHSFWIDKEGKSVLSVMTFSVE